METRNSFVKKRKEILLSKRGSVINQKVAGESSAVAWMDVGKVAKIKKKITRGGDTSISFKSFPEKQ